MPKKIDDLSKLIVLEAKKCFEKNGYQNVEMTMIANEANIAVGTIYNYYSTKAKLFLATVKLSWQELEENLDRLETENSQEKLKKTIKAYYEFGKSKKGLWEDVIQAKLKDNRKSLYSRNVKGLDRIINIIIEVLNDHNCNNIDYGKIKRISINIIMTIVGFLRELPDEDEKNFKFLCDIIDNHLDVLLTNKE